MNTGFLNSINYFRGLAIVAIVFGHSYGLSNIDVDTVFDRTFFSLIKHGSVYFIFISGFLFHHIYFVKKANSFKYPTFIKKKISYVFVPYLLISIVPIIFRVFYLENRHYVADWATNNDLLSLLWYVLTGKIFVGYWYVPTGMILFLLSPLIIKLIESKYCLPTIIFLLGVALIIHRPVDNLNPIHSTIYFLPTYILGCYASKNRNHIYSYMKSKTVVFSVIAISLAFMQALFWENPGSAKQDFVLLSSNFDVWSVNKIDIILIQKIVICFLLMSLLYYCKKIDIKALEWLAQRSFAIYFIHPILMSIGRWVVVKNNLSYEGNYLIWFGVGSYLLLGSMAIAQIIKILFKKNSRYLIGW
ncbi:MAG: acyltransferase [Cyanobacteria bacterium P01_G01_bin.19]